MSGRLHQRGWIDGWALPLGSFSKAHFFQRAGASEVISLCRRRTGYAGRLFDAGSFPRCKQCEQSIRLHGLRAPSA